MRVLVCPTSAISVTAVFGSNQSNAESEAADAWSWNRRGSCQSSQTGNSVSLKSSRNICSERCSRREDGEDVGRQQHEMDDAGQQVRPPGTIGDDRDHETERH